MRLTPAQKAPVWRPSWPVWGERWPIHLPLGPYVRVDDMPQGIGALKHMPWVPTRPQLGSLSLKLVKNETDPSPKSTCVEVKLACMGRKLAHPFAIGTICEGSCSRHATRNWATQTHALGAYTATA